MLINLLLRERPGQSLTDHVYFMRQTFDDCNETCEMIYGSVAIHPSTWDSSCCVSSRARVPSDMRSNVSSTLSTQITFCPVTR
jgi:hypothetical protein